jgi:hypothetical protein
VLLGGQGSICVGGANVVKLRAVPPSDSLRAQRAFELAVLGCACGGAGVLPRLTCTWDYLVGPDVNLRPAGISDLVGIRNAALHVFRSV